jgi:anti-sigma regulatory factor (Ser/Thr protein kinase)
MTADATPWAAADLDPSVPPLVSTGFDGDPRTLAETRRRLERWAVAAGLSDTDVGDLVLAGYEAMVNASEHAYTDDPRPIDLLAACTLDGSVMVTVRDHGRWRPPPPDPGFRGRGLLLIRKLAHDADIQNGPDGTAVHMRWRRVPD